MKNIVIGLTSTVLLLLAMLLVFTVFGRQTRTTELNNGLNNAMTIAIGMLEEESAPTSNEELVADFMQAFFMQIDSASDITIEILDVDYTIGLLSVRATSHYKHLTGQDGSVSVEKTIILEAYEDETAITFSDITYTVAGRLYRSYEVQTGSKHIVPPNPTGESGTFAGWQITTGMNKGTVYSPSSLSNMNVEEDVIYVAIFN